MTRSWNNEDENSEWVRLSSNDRSAMEKYWRDNYIFRVPDMQRVGGEDKYEPRAISIGPFHRHKENLVLTTIYKKYYLNSLISQNTTPNIIWTTIVKKISEVQAEARKCYAESIDMDDDDFVQMLILDGCFIIELLYRYELKDQCEMGAKDKLFSSNWIIPSIRRDLVLLENQIPFSVLALLFELTLAPREHRNYTHNSSSKQTHPKKYLNIKNHFAGCFNIQYHSQTGFPTQTKSSSLAELIVNFFDPILPTVPSATICPNLRGEHLLDLLRNHLLASKHISLNVGNEPTWEHTTSATDLKQGGVKLRRKYPNRGLFDITFRNGTLEVPPFYFGQSWTVLLPNMIVLEQCRGDYLDIVTSYAILMDNLIDLPEDVKILRNGGIIEGSYKEDETIAHVVNNLCKDITYGHFYYDGLCNQVNTYRHTAWNKWRSNLKRNYIHSRWAGVSIIAAFFLLVLTFAQTVVSILQWRGGQDEY